MDRNKVTSIIKFLATECLIAYIDSAALFASPDNKSAQQKQKEAAEEAYKQAKALDQSCGECLDELSKTIEFRNYLDFALTRPKPGTGSLEELTHWFHLMIEHMNTIQRKYGTKPAEEKLSA